MGRRRTETVLVTKVTGLAGDGAAGAVTLRRQPDELIVEEPMSIQLDGTLVATTMRTPGHDYELAVGFCFTDGLLGGAHVTGVRYCATGPAAEYGVQRRHGRDRWPRPAADAPAGHDDVELRAVRLGDPRRAAHAPLAPLPADRAVRFPVDLLAEIPGRVPTSQALFASTGAVHAAAAFTASARSCSHGRTSGATTRSTRSSGGCCWTAGLPAHGLGLYVSGRASFEIVQKAWAAGFAAVVAVSAPTALAVATARAAGMLLAGFARPAHLNVYAPERVE